MSSDFPRGFAVGAIVLALIAAVVLGIIIGYDLKPSTSTTSVTPSPAPTSTASSTTPSTTSTTSSPTASYADVTLVVQGDVKLGSDGLLHDAFTPCNFTVYAGQEVNLTIVNYDNGEHTFTSQTLNVNFVVPPSNVTGVPTVSNFQFNETTAGVYRWYCTVPCDNDAGGWAMTTGSDGQPDQVGFMAGFVTVLPG